jgi:DNA primase
MPFLRDNSDVRFAFVTGGKDPDEILRKGNPDDMKKIIDSAVPLVDFLWNITNKNFLTNTPAGRTQAEKFLKKELEKITDKLLRAEYEHEYESRKFNNWHKWKKTSETVRIEVPEIDTIVKNTIISIINKYPTLAERYGDFISKFNLDFSENTPDCGLSFDAAEKYLVSLKLQKYIESLEKQKRDLTVRGLSGENDVSEEIRRIDDELNKMREKFELLV